MNENLGNKLDTIEDNTRESSRMLNRIAERTRGESTGFEEKSSDGGREIRNNPNEDVEIIDSESSPEMEPEPDVEHIDEDKKMNDNGTASYWGYAEGIFERLQELEGIETRSPKEAPSEIIDATIDEEETNEPSHWVTEEAEDISLVLSKEINGNELYITVAVADEITQVNYHVAQAGFPGLVGTDPIQNELTKKLSNLAKETYGENAVLTVHSGQIIVSIPATDLNNVKDWIESSVEEMENIIIDMSSYENEESGEKQN